MYTTRITPARVCGGLSVTATFATVRTRSAREVAVAEVTLTGELDAATAPDAFRELQTTIAARWNAIIVDTTGLTYCASAGVDLLHRIDRTTTDMDSKTIVVADHRPVLRILALADDNGHLTVVPTMTEACRVLSDDDVSAAVGGYAFRGRH